MAITNEERKSIAESYYRETAKRNSWKFQPLYEQVLIKPIKFEAVTKSGLILSNPNDKTKEMMKWEVLWFWMEVNSLKIWDIVWFDRYVPHKMELDWETYMICLRKEIKLKEIQ